MKRNAITVHYYNHYYALRIKCVHYYTIIVYYYVLLRLYYYQLLHLVVLLLRINQEIITMYYFPGQLGDGVC